MFIVLVMPSQPDNPYRKIQMPQDNVRLVSSSDQVRASHATYQREMSSLLGKSNAPLIDVMSYILSWIAIRDRQGKYMFAPSKFVGYRDMTAEIYNRNYDKMMDGRETEVAIKDWIKVMDKSDPDYDAARDQLFDFCAKFGKKPNGRCRISMLRDADRQEEEKSPSKIADLLVEVYKSLPAFQQRDVARRIAAR